MKCSILWETSVSSSIPVKPMARLLCFALIISVSVLIYVLAEEERYSDKYDYVDLHAVMNNKEMRDAYYECYLERAKCQSEEQAFLTGLFSEAYATNCKKCTKMQTEGLKLVVDYYSKIEPDKWKILVKKSEEDMKANQ